MLAVVVALSSLRPVASQTIKGKVVDATSGMPISMAHVTLIGASGMTVGSNVTDTDGSFLIPVSEAGTYRLRAMRIGYTPFMTDTLVLWAGEEADVQLMLRAIAVPLPPVEAVAEARMQRLVRVGFYKRRTNALGYFRTPEDLDSLRPVFHAELFGGMGGVRIGPDGRVLSRRSHKKCYLTVAIDGVIVESGGPSDQPWTDVVHVGDIEAIEVFPGPVGVPVWLSRRVSDCGAVLVWTKGSR